jgi:chorismate dehydratase
MTNKLRIGEIPYFNVLPIFYALKNKFDCSAYEFIKGVPSKLNQMLRDNEVDVSFSSSIEYLKHENEYDYIDGHSISSTGPIGSISLFSKVAIEKLNGRTILVSSQSETSIALLQIIFREFLKIDCSLKSEDITYRDLGSGFTNAWACLLIGDDAMLGAKKYFGSFNNIYDLGELWFKHTGTPFTFAMWLHKKDCCLENKDVFNRFKADLHNAREFAAKNLKAIAAVSPLKDVFSEEELAAYWNRIEYDFNDKHKKGLELFKTLSKQLQLL